MKRSTPYWVFGVLILLILSIIVLAPAKDKPAVAIEEALVTATLMPSLTLSPNDDGMVYAAELPDGVLMTATLAPSATSLPGEVDGVVYADEPTAQAVNAQSGAVIQAPTATRTPTPINVGNFVWDDLDGDGRQDAGEPGMAGVQVQLWNSAKNDLIDTDVTTASGSYTLIAPTPGNYRVRVLLPSPALDQFSPKDNAADDLTDSDINPDGADKGFTDAFNLASNVISTTKYDAGIIKFRTPTPTRTPTPINIGNLVWDDYDSDGIQDASEPGMAGVTVQLWNSAKNDLIDTDVTTASGSYTLIAPTPGNYRVRVLLPSPALDEFSPKDNAADDQTDSDINPSGTDFGFTDTYVFASNLISITTIDAGIIRYKTPTPTRTPTPINVGNFVWNDLNDNGLQDGGEPGLGGITVQLWNSAKTTMFGTTTTNANGNYTLIAPVPGDYRVRVILPTGGDQFTIKDAGTDTLDSDFNPSGTSAGFTDIYTFDSFLISISSIDAGLSFVQLTPTPSPTPTITPTPHPANAAPIRNFDRDAVIRFTWVGVSWAVGYELEVDNDATFASPVYENHTMTKEFESLWVMLPYTDGVYYWRVGAKASNGTITWSAAQTVTVNTP